MRVVLTGDAKYAPHIATFVESLAGHEDSSKVEIRVFAVDWGLYLTRRFLRWASKKFDNLFMHQVAPDLLDGLDGRGHLSPVTHLRAHVPELLGDSEPIVYCDADALVLGDLSVLRAKLEQMRVESASSPLIWAVDAKQNRAPSLQQFGLMSGSYFNAGILLLNSYRWRKEGLASRYRRLYQRYGPLLVHPNQDTMNLAVNGDWKRLPREYNYMESFARDERAKIVHFVGGRHKPWKPDSRHAYRLEYRQVSQSTVFPWSPVVSKVRHLFHRLCAFLCSKKRRFLRFYRGLAAIVGDLLGR